MNPIYQLFFELIQASVGAGKCLSRSPSDAEWKQLYELAEKHSLTGVTFAGVEVVGLQEQKPDLDLLMDWLGQAEYIRTTNELVNKQCVEIQERLHKANFRTSIVKGQGVGSLYGEKLSLLRQSGDIDILVDSGIEKALAYSKTIDPKVNFDYINAHIPVFKDTEVELHWRAQALTNLFANKRLQKWLEKEETQKQMFGGKATLADGIEISVPTAEFNAFYILLHCYHHMFESGLGLRQIMDYYFVLRKRNNYTPNENANIIRLFKEFGMMRFTKGMMWIMKRVFALEDRYLICEPDKKEGEFLLREIMQNGNFGHHDERKHNFKSKLLAPFATRIQHNWHLATHYPTEFFWAPIWLVFHFIWKRTRK